MKYIREMSAASQMAAWAILNKRGERVASVLAHYPKDGAGTLTVEVHHVHRDGVPFVEVQQGKAGGYGYDKLAAALRGLKIDGITMLDHCQQDARAEKLQVSIRRKAAKGAITYEQAQLAAKKIGARIANWFPAHYERDTVKPGAKCDVYTSPGLKRLEDAGYTVWQIV